MKKIFTTNTTRIVTAALVLSLAVLMGTPVPGALASPAPTKRYVALGDSVAAGAGLPLKDYTPHSEACGQSAQAYPFSVGTALGVPVEQVACGGATIKQGIIGPQTVDWEAMTFPAQIDQAYSAAVAPTHISLTVGTNDLNWSQFIGKCYAQTCGTWQDTLAIIQLQQMVFYDLQKAMEQVRQKHPRGTPLPKVVLTGYFQPLSNKQPACADTQGLTASEIDWMRHQDQLLNNMIRSVAALYLFVEYAPVDFRGHELCSANSWIQGFKDRAAYHPTQKGQQVIAEAVVRAFK